jgi:hypothetical protein
LAEAWLFLTFYVDCGRESGVSTDAVKTPDFFSSQIDGAKRFYLDLKPSRTGPLTVVCGGYEHCTPDYEIHRSGFPFWSIEFVAQGKGDLGLKGKHYSLGPGTLFSYGPGIAHDIGSDPEETLVKYFVDFTGRESESLLRSHGPAPGRVLQTSAFRRPDSERTAGHAVQFADFGCAARTPCLEGC